MKQYSNEDGLTFHEVPGSVVILASKGVYNQTKAYVRDGRLYAKHGSGFIQLTRYGTSVPNVRVDGFDLDGLDYEFMKSGRAALTQGSLDALNIDHRPKIEHQP